MKVGPYWDDWVYPAGNSSDASEHDEELAEDEDPDEDGDEEEDDTPTEEEWYAVDWGKQTVYVTEEGEQSEEPEQGAYVEVERVLWAKYRQKDTENTVIYEYGQIWDAEVNQ